MAIAAMPSAFSEGPEHLEVWLDGLSIGTFDFWWDEAQPLDKAHADLRKALSFFLDEEFSEGWW